PPGGCQRGGRTPPVPAYDGQVVRLSGSAQIALEQAGYLGHALAGQVEGKRGVRAPRRLAATQREGRGARKPAAAGARLEAPKRLVKARHALADSYAAIGEHIAHRQGEDDQQGDERSR